MKITMNAIEYTAGLAVGAAAAIGTAEMLYNADEMAMLYDPYALKGKGIQVCKDVAKAGIAGAAGLGTMVFTWMTIESVKELVGLK